MMLFMKMIKGAKMRLLPKLNLPSMEWLDFQEAHEDLRLKN
jgi:hypothetical protein